MALSLSRARVLTPHGRSQRAAILCPARAHPNNNKPNTNPNNGLLSSALDSVGAALTRVVFSPPSRDNADVPLRSGGFPGKLPARHGAPRRPFASPGPMAAAASPARKMPPVSPMASMSEDDEEEQQQGQRGSGNGCGSGGGPAGYLSGALGRVFGGQAGMGDHDGPPTTGAIGWSGEAASRRHSQRRRGIGGGF